MYISSERGKYTGTQKLWKETEIRLIKNFEICKDKSNIERERILNSCINNLNSRYNELASRQTKNVYGVLYVLIKKELVDLLLEYFHNLIASKDYENIEVWKKKCFDDYIKSEYILTK